MSQEQSPSGPQEGSPIVVAPVVAAPGVIVSYIMPPPPPYAEAPPSYAEAVASKKIGDEEFNKRLSQIADRYEMDQSLLNKIVNYLIRYEIKILNDDSGSMNDPLLNSTSGSSRPESRFKYLENINKIIIEIASLLDEDGIDIYFLNRKGMENVQSLEQCASLFGASPSGRTDILRMINSMYESHFSKPTEGRKPLLTLFFTDGYPTDYYEQHTNQYNLDRVFSQISTLQSRYLNEAFFSVILTIEKNTPEGKRVHDAYSRFDEIIPNFDVVSQYHDEREEVMEIQKKDPEFTFNMAIYIAKILLGSLDNDFDNMDEIRIPWSRIISETPNPRATKIKNAMPIREEAPTGCCTIS